MVEDDGAVIRPDVRSLAVFLGRVVDVPEYLEELVIRDDPGVEFDPDSLCVAGRTGADLLVCRVLDCPPGVAGPGPDHAPDTPESSLNAPETACCKCRLFKSLSSCMIRPLWHNIMDIMVKYRRSHWWLLISLHARWSVFPSARTAGTGW